MQGDEEGSELIGLTQSRTFQCEICSHKYSSEGNLKRHCAKAHGDILLECEICQVKTFTSHDELDAHRASHFTIENDASLTEQTTESDLAPVKREDDVPANLSLYSAYAEAVSKFYRSF